MAKKCRKCGDYIPNRIKIEGKTKNISSRLYCLFCSPWGKHNTKKVENNDCVDGLKKCKKCGEIKTINDFYIRKRGGHRHFCKECQNRDTSLMSVVKKKKIVEIMGGKCCECGYDKYYGSLEMHHKDPKEKEFSWNNIRFRKWDIVLNEIKKCILVCSNCHKEIHAKNLSDYSSGQAPRLLTLSRQSLPS
jgi:predicted HNH restriction endonuclease